MAAKIDFPTYWSNVSGRYDQAQSAHEDAEIQEILETIGVGRILDAIGKDACIDHFEIEEAEEGEEE